MQQGVHLGPEQGIEDIVASLGAERIGGVVGRRIGRAFAEEHILLRGDKPSLVSLAQKDMFARVRFSPVVVYGRVDPQEGLGHRLQFKQVDRETGLDMPEPGAERLIPGIEVEILDGESFYLLARLEGFIGRLSHR